MGVVGLVGLLCSCTRPGGPGDFAYFIYVGSHYSFFSSPLFDMNRPEDRPFVVLAYMPL